MNQTASEFSALRYQMIMEYIQNRGSVTVKCAAELCQVSEATARRYLDDMAVQGMVKRIYGGALRVPENTWKTMHLKKMGHMIMEKSRIADKAFSMIQNGNSIFLDSGTTTFLLAKQLYRRKNLTVVTHSLDIALQIELDRSSVMMITGGIRREGHHVLAGQIAEDLVDKLSMDMVFLGADAVIPDSGVYNKSFWEIGIKKSALKSGRQKILLCDHTKFQSHALTRVCDIGSFDTVLTDSGIDKETQKILAGKVKNVIMV